MKTILGVRIAELRKNRNLTQGKLAEELGLATSNIAMWEVGRRDPNTEMISKLATYFNVSSDYLLGITDDPSIENNSETPSSISTWLRSTSNDLTEEEKETLAEDMEEYFKMRKARILKKRQ